MSHQFQGTILINPRRDHVNRARAETLYKQGQSVVQIGRALGKHKTLIFKWVRDAGILRPRSETDQQRVLTRGDKPKCHLTEAFEVEMALAKRWDSNHWKDHPEIQIHKSKLLYSRHSDVLKARSKANYNARKNDPAFMAKRKSAMTEWQRKNPEKLKASKRVSHKAWRKRPENRVAIAQRRRFKEIMGLKNKMRTVDMIGCSVLFLRGWLEAKWRKGMTWENYGKEWCIDHVIPCAAFDLSNKQQVKTCFHYTNLQPLWNAENSSKCDTITPTQPELCMPI